MIMINGQFSVYKDYDDDDGDVDEDESDDHDNKENENEDDDKDDDDRKDDDENYDGDDDNDNIDEDAFVATFQPPINGSTRLHKSTDYQGRHQRCLSSPSSSYV